MNELAAELVAEIRKSAPDGSSELAQKLAQHNTILLEAELYA